MKKRYLPDSDTFAIFDKARKLVRGELYEI
jgi:hypothetical protein